MIVILVVFFFFFSSRRRHTRYWRDWSSDVCSSDLDGRAVRTRPPLGCRDVVLLLPCPALAAPPLAPLVAAALDEREERRVGDRRARDAERRQRDRMAGPLVVVGPRRRVGAHEERAAGDVDPLGVAGERRCVPRRAARQATEPQRLAHRLGV